MKIFEVLRIQLAHPKIIEHHWNHSMEKQYKALNSENKENRQTG